MHLSQSLRANFIKENNMTLIRTVITMFAIFVGSNAFAGGQHERSKNGLKRNDWEDVIQPWSPR